MRFEIPFDEIISRKQSEFIFDMHWKEALKKNRKSLYIGITALLLGVLVIFGKDNLGFVFIAMGCYLLLNFFNYKQAYNKNKKIYSKAIDDNVSSYLSQKSPDIWQFLDENFHYSNYRFDLKIKWEFISTFKVINDYIILEVTNNIACNFILEKQEVGAQSYNEIIVFLESKIKRDGIL